MPEETEKSGLSLMSVLDKLELDVNQLVAQLTEELKSLSEDNTNAVIFNASEEEVHFFCYNDSDELRWIPARDPICPPGATTLVNKGPLGWGPTIQIWVNKEKGPFYVLRKHAYVWDGSTFSEKDELSEALAS